MTNLGGSDNGGMFAYDNEGQRAGNDLWYQIPRFYCQLCGIFMDNNKPTKEHHFSGYRHRMNKEAKIREIQKIQKEKSEIEELKADTIKYIEQKGRDAYRRDMGLLPATEEDMIRELSNWKEVYTENGEVYFWHEKSNKTQWDKPPGWEKYRKAREKLVAQKDKKVSNIKSLKSSESTAMIAKRSAKMAGIGGAMTQGSVNNAISSLNKPTLSELKSQAATYNNQPDYIPDSNKPPESIIPNYKNSAYPEPVNVQDLGLPKPSGTKNKQKQADTDYRNELYSNAWSHESDKNRIKKNERTVDGDLHSGMKDKVGGKMKTIIKTRNKITFHKRVKK